MSLIKIAVTLPFFYEKESERIIKILSDEEAHFVHLRKPGAEIKEIEKLISEIPAELHCRIKLHDHFKLLEKFQLGGIHLNSRNKEIHPLARSKSISLHSLEETEGKEDFDYFFISPIFDSISKKGYKAAFDLNNISKKIKGKKAIALGGVTPERFPLILSLGFYGAAMSGYFFTNDDVKCKKIL